MKECTIVHSVCSKAKGSCITGVLMVGRHFWRWFCAPWSKLTGAGYSVLCPVGFWIHPRFLAWPCCWGKFFPWYSLSDHFSRLESWLWKAALPSVLSTSLPSVVSSKWWRSMWPHHQAFSEWQRYLPQFWPLGCTTDDLCGKSNPLNPAVQPVFSPTYPAWTWAICHLCTFYLGSRDFCFVTSLSTSNYRGWNASSTFSKLGVGAIV